MKNTTVRKMAKAAVLVLQLALAFTGELHEAVVEHTAHTTRRSASVAR